MTDFSLAKRVESGQGLTQSGAIMGTPSYMAPEQAAGDTRDVGPAADVYALGGILYELLTGRPPFVGARPMDTIMQVLLHEPVPPRQLHPGLPRDLETIALKCLQKAPRKRYTSAAALADDLGRFLAGEPIQARPVGVWERGVKWARRRPAAAALLALLAVAAVALPALILSANAQLQRERDNAVQQQQVAAGERDSARKARAEADQARKQAETALIDTHAASGLMASDQGNHAQALLWFASAAGLARHDPERQRVNRIRVRTWSQALSMPLRAFAHQGVPLREMAFHPGGHHLLTVTNGGRWFLWDLDQERALALPRADRPVRAAVWGPDGTWLALGLAEGTVEVVSFPQGQSMYRIPSPGGVTALAVSRDGSLLAVAGRSARVWDCSTRRFLSPDLPHPQPVVHLAFNGRGDRLATASRDGLARVFALPGDGEPLFPPVSNAVPRELANQVPPLKPAFIDQDRGLLTLSSGTALAWRDAATGREIRQVVPFNRPFIHAVVPSPDGRYFAVCGFPGAQLWEVATARRAGELMAHRNGVGAAAFSPDGRTLVTASGDRRAGLWSVPLGKAAAPAILHLDGVTHAAYAPDGRLFATAQSDGLVRLWRPAGPAPGDFRLPTSFGSPGTDTFVALSPDGQYLAAVGSNRRGGLLATRVHATASGRAVGPTLRAPGLLNGGTFAPDGRRLILLCAQTDRADERYWESYRPDQRAGWVQFWDWQAGTQVLDALATTSEPVAAAYSPDGKRLVVLCAGGQVLLLNPLTGRPEAQQRHGGVLQPGLSFVGQVQFAPDGRSFVTCGLGPRARLWDSATGKPLHRPLEHANLCFAATFSPDGRYLATASADKNVRVWDTQTGQPVGPTLEHPDWVFQARFSRDGSQLLTACRDHMARLWDWRAGRLVAPALTHQDEIFDACFSPDGRWILTASRDYTARLWAVSTAKPITPPLPLFGLGYQGLITPDGRRAIVAGLCPFVHGFDLSALANPAGLGLGADDLKALGELVSAQSIHAGGGTVNLTSAEWLDRWQRFRAAHPAFHQLRPGP